MFLYFNNLSNKDAKGLKAEKYWGSAVILTYVLHLYSFIGGFKCYKSVQTFGEKINQ